MAFAFCLRKTPCLGTGESLLLVRAYFDWKLGVMAVSTMASLFKIEKLSTLGCLITLCLPLR